MKKIIMLLMFCCSFAVQASAQEIMEEVKNIMDGYEKVKNDTSKDLEIRKIATFKWDAIYYMILQASDKGHMTEPELGLQVNAMIEFVNQFLADMKDNRKRNQKEVTLAKYRAASLKNPLYGDTDKDACYAYVDHPNFLTQFSLDTDWVKALEAVK